MTARAWVGFGAAILAGIAALVGCSGRAGAQKTAAQPIRVNVVAETVGRHTLYQERKLLGALGAYRETDLAPLMGGRVKSLRVKIGDAVRVGQIVAQMDDMQLVSTNAQFQSVEAQYMRAKALYEANAIPKAQFETTEAQYTAMKRQLASQQENTTLSAPFDGVVTDKAVEEGELYAPTPIHPGLVHIAQLSPLKLDLDVDDQTVGHMAKGMQVRLKVDNVPDSIPVYATVEYVNPQASAASRTFGARLVVPNPGQRLRPGFFAEAHIVLGQKDSVVAVPLSAIVEDRVFVLHDSLALARPVTLGFRTEDWAEVVSGVTAGDIVVTRGNKALPDSAIVNVTRR